MFCLYLHYCAAKSSNRDADTGQWRRDRHAQWAVAIPVAENACRESEDKNEGHQVRLIKADLVSWGLQ